MHADIFTLTAQKLLFNVSQRDMQEHWPAVWTGKRHSGAGQIVQQGAIKDELSLARDEMSQCLTVPQDKPS